MNIYIILFYIQVIKSKKKKNLIIYCYWYMARRVLKLLKYYLMVVKFILQVVNNITRILTNVWLTKIKFNYEK